MGDVPILEVRTQARLSRRGNSSRRASPPGSYHTKLKEEEDEEVSLSYAVSAYNTGPGLT